VLVSSVVCEPVRDVEDAVLVISVVWEPVRGVEDAVLIATTEMYVLPLEMYVLRLDDTDARRWSARSPADQD
jgi:hypothetical protein